MRRTAAICCQPTAGHPSSLRPRSLHLMFLTLAALALLAMVLTSPGFGLETGAGAVELGAPQSVAPAGVLDYEDCIRIALRQSPYLTKSALEIQVRRLDESDSRYGMIPPLTFRTYYYLNQPQSVYGFSPRPYSLSFNMEPYNPVGSYFGLQAQKMASQMAIYAHLQNIAAGLQNLGNLFLKLDTLRQLAAYQTDLVSIAREQLIYAENRQKIGTGTSLELRLATQDLELTQGEQERIRRSESSTLAQVKSFLGFKDGPPLHLNVRDARRQVLGKFQPATATLEQAKARSYDLKIMKLREKLQGYNITVAKARIFPSLLFTTQTPDPLSLTHDHGLYVGFGLEIPVWDGFKRIRNVSRQKVILKQYAAEKDVKEMDLGDRWRDFQAQVQDAELALKLAKGQEELARLKERQAEIRYQSGAVELPAYLEARKEVLEARKTTALKAMSYHQAVLNLRLISGDLGQSYVHASSWQN